jgi:hypothetical protein
MAMTSRCIEVSAEDAGQQREVAWGGHARASSLLEEMKAMQPAMWYRVRMIDTGMTCWRVE